MIHGRFSLHGSSKLSGAIPAVIFGGIAPIANVAIHWGWMCFCTFPISSNFCEKLLLLQEDRNGLPGCMERIQLLLAVSSQKPKRDWLMIGLSRENKKTGNDRQLFSPCAHQLCSLTSKCKNSYILLCTLYPIYLYMYNSMYICVGVLLKHIVRV